MTQYTDESGSIFGNTYDPLGRKTTVTISLATEVTGTTAQSFQYDGLSRQTFARDSVGSTNADVTINYDSLGRTLEEAQVYAENARYLTNIAFASTPATSVMYPNNRQVDSGYDALYRRDSYTEHSSSASIAAWQYFGPSRVAKVVLGNGLIQTMMNNARTHSAVQATMPNPAWGDASSDRLGYDGAGRMITKRYLADGIDGTTHAYNNPSSVAGFTTYYDHTGNKLYERQLQAENRSALYEPFVNFVPQGGYDSANRLLQYQRGTLDSAGGFGNNGGGDITSPITLTGTNQSQTYDLDGLGNWKNTTYLPVGASTITTETRRHNYLNELTKFGTTPVTYDHGNNSGATAQRGNGNIANDGSRIYAYDALNRLLTVKRTSDNDTIATYVYDALGRRIRKTVTNGGLSGSVPNGTTDYLYLGWQCLEERDGSNNPLRQYVWGLYIDELVQLTALQSVGTQPLAAGTYYPLQDLLYRTQCLTNSTGGVVEVYDTDAYGNTNIFASYSATTPLAAPACEQIFTGQRYDPETENCYYRARYYQPGLGRFISRDPDAYVNGANIFLYGIGNPTVYTDPLGTDCQDRCFSLYGNGRSDAAGPLGQCISCCEDAGNDAAAQSICFPQPGSGSSGGNGGTAPSSPPTPPTANSYIGPNGGICYTPCPPNHDRLTCMTNCVQANDPLNLLAKGLLTGLGGPIPKALLNALGMRTTVFGGGASPFTTPPSIVSQQLGLGPRSGLRLLGRISFWAWLAYADYMAGVEDACLGACIGNPCEY